MMKDICIGLIGLILFHVPSDMNSQSYFTEKATELDIIGTFGHEEYGGGLSFVDFDQDGYDDLTFATQGGNNIIVYRNINGAHFEKLPFFVSHSGFQKQVLWADLDNDKDLDLTVACYQCNSQIYENTGDLSLRAVTDNGGITEEGHSTFCMIAGDVDSDGLLDLYMGTHGTSPGNNFLYHNQGDFTFKSIIDHETWLAVPPNCTTASFCDIDRDLDPDIFVARDKAKKDYLLLNEGNLLYVDISSSIDIEEELASMNAGFGDINNDGYLDIYITDTPVRDGNILLLNNGDYTFTDISKSSGTQFDSFCWSGNFADFNNDGYQDIYVCSQYNNPEDHNRLFINNGDLTFTEADDPAIVNYESTSYSSAIGDYNNDGRLDIAVSNGNFENFSFFENIYTENNYLKVSLEGTVSTRDGVGVWIEAYANDLVQYRYSSCGLSYTAQDSKVSHFGMANHDVIDSIIVRWPSGIVNKLENVKVNQHLKLIEAAPEDADGDGVAADLDCNDNNPAIHPFALDIVNSEIDENCDGISEEIDFDGDGFNSSIDCNDTNADINPDQPEIPNNTIDENCDGISEVIDADSDGYNSDEDCNDTNDQINPDAIEVPNNGIDENCDGIIEVVDNDNDGFHAGEDCDDMSASINPEATEVPNNQIDENCDGIIEIIDNDGDGFNSDVDCNDENSSINSDQTEIANNDVDENCDGIVLVIDEDGDGYNSDEDCNDIDSTINPGQDEIPNNNIDENCDGELGIVDSDNDGYNSNEDCNDNDAGISPGSIEIANNEIDENCDGIVLIIDEDGDGYNSDEDCNDNDAGISPGSIEVANNDIDENCDGIALIIDEDGDGYNSDEDCNDNNMAINPGQTEIPNNDIDENCDGELGVVDSDNDGYNSDVDCDDNNPAISPEATEIANNDIDENCDGFVLIIDEDGDGYNSDEDCNDADIAINPGQPEIPNNDIDENCDGEFGIVDSDNDGFTSDEDCDDNNSEISPGAIEVPNNDIDENCDGIALIIDEDNDGFNSDEDCEDLDAFINPGAEEIPNNDIDENCDGIAQIIDEDNDGFNSDEDCDDSNPDIFPGAEEITNNDIDEDCDGEDVISATNNINPLSEIVLYPNPLHDHLYLEQKSIQNLNLTIFTAQGKSVQDIKSRLKRITLNTSNLNPGIYFLEIKNESNSVIRKIVKL